MDCGDGSNSVETTKDSTLSDNNINNGVTLTEFQQIKIKRREIHKKKKLANENKVQKKNEKNYDAVMDLGGMYGVDDKRKQ